MQFSRSGLLISGAGLLLLVLMAVFSYDVLNPSRNLLFALIGMFAASVQGAIVALAFTLLFTGILINVL